ncbi:hypothetical protein JZ751_012992 [Albula glossodonta]|uniref:SUI1 domain-containing protein n=1 Tax=Albula glossodonta TaxID=121402 RepID=A0A8T2N401_9TELE|nr:hypothetical protein JZ751_012992 [Albula glossodonta]
MATTESAESGSPENKVDRKVGDTDARYPLKVLYCGVCSLPTEYCEYMPEPAKCRQWLEKNFPDEFAKMTIGGRGQIKQKKKTVPQKVTIAKIPRAKKKYVTRVCGLNTFGKQREPCAASAVWKTAQLSRCTRMSLVLSHKSVGLEVHHMTSSVLSHKSVGLEVRHMTSSVLSHKSVGRRSRHMTSSVLSHKSVGRSKYTNNCNIDLREAQRFFAQKFSCGASVTAEDEIIIQGDFTDDIIDVIQDKWPEVDDDSIEDLGEVKK